MKIFDLTLRLEKGMRGVDYEPAFTVARDGWNARTLHLYSHCGTHMDSPFHFAAGDQTIDEIPISDCIGKAWVVGLDHLADRTPITVAHLDNVAGRVARGDAILIRTLWSRHVLDADHYRNNFPPISPELGHWMVDRGVRLIGVEPPSVGDVNDLAAVTEIHQILLSAGVIIVEGLTGLDQLTEPSCLFGAMPLKIAGGDGAPCRAFAIEGASW